MRHGDEDAVNLAGALSFQWDAAVERQLMAEEVDIEPGLGLTTKGALERVEIETACGGEVVDTERKMEEVCVMAFPVE